MRKTWESTCSFFLLTGVLIVADTALAFLSIELAPAVAGGVSWLYVAVAFTILFTLWFGAYGAVAAYIGTFLGSGILTGMPFDVCAYWSLAGLWQVLIPLVALRISGVDLALRTGRDVILLIIFGVVVNNVIGAAWGASTLALGGVIGTGEIAGIFTAWLAGNVVVTIFIVPPALHTMTPRVQESRFFIKRYWE